MKFLFASDSFKGSLSSEKIIELLTKTAKEVFPDCETLGIPMADGGEGTTAAVLACTGGRWQEVTVRGPLGKPVTARYGICPGREAAMEMAGASGLPLVPVKERDPRRTGTWGTGEMIADALARGIRRITIAIGGSATNDGGMGALTALGVRFLDAKGRELSGCGADLGKVAAIDASGLLPAVRETQFTVMCDVDNPLLGPDGATWTFGAQKGASEAVQRELEAGMVHYAGCLQAFLGAPSVDTVNFPGAGAAGGLGAALKTFLHAELKSGGETGLELVGFDRLLDGVDCVITGEGRIDWQSAHGKVISGVAAHCRKNEIPVIALVGSMGKNAEKTYECGIRTILPIVEGPVSLEEAMEKAETLYEGAARRMFRLLQIGIGMKKQNKK